MGPLAGQNVNFQHADWDNMFLKCSLPQGSILDQCCISYQLMTRIMFPVYLVTYYLQGILICLLADLMSNRFLKYGRWVEKWIHGGSKVIACVSNIKQNHSHGIWNLNWKVVDEGLTIVTKNRTIQWVYKYCFWVFHCSDVIMSPMASQITSLVIVYSTVYSGTDQRKHQSPASLAFVWGIHRWSVNSPHKGPVTRKMFPFDDVIMSYRQLAFSYSSQWTLDIIITPCSDLHQNYATTSF